VGSRTFGKGSVQMPSRLPGGSVAELTVGHYRTPGGHDVDGHGITPDLDAGGDALRRARTVLAGLGESS
jgi:carboxyl-terminal processing protease